ncbi:unnamed protein product [Adineta steineri]|uniref:NAD(P)(+)--arginine ADP-ribosyltransferase n=1 Tax=Adineta steineri TaxID=433720 RepID=A0A815LIL5_9BILA|nr:unnamed protein product [Adineta steineri]CAF3986879.1 unnamed protein product [Adineta steineri]
MGSDGQVILHVASFCGHSETVQFFLTDSAFTSLANISSQLTLFDQLKRASSLYDYREEIPDNIYIVWSTNGESLIRKGREFRKQIDLYKTYDNQHHLITMLLIEIVEYYLNEYLTKQENVSSTKIDELKTCFREAIDEQNYLKYFVKAYTLTNGFHRVLNKHLALYILHYFDARPYSSTPAEYRLINCLVHIVTLVINHPDVRQHKYKGITYRGMLMSPNDLKPYRIGHYILNKSFVSTSKNREVAQMYAGSGQESVSGAISNHHDSSEVSVIFKFTSKQDDTALDIKHMSMVEGEGEEEEVLILPFSVFQVKDRIEKGSNADSSGLIEIDLEECEDNEQINNRKPKNNHNVNESCVEDVNQRSIESVPEWLIWSYLNVFFGVIFIGLIAIGCSIRTHKFKQQQNYLKACKWSYITLFINCIGTLSGLAFTGYLIFRYPNI